MPRLPRRRVQVIVCARLQEAEAAVAAAGERTAYLECELAAAVKMREAACEAACEAAEEEPAEGPGMCGAGADVVVSSMQGQLEGLMQAMQAMAAFFAMLPFLLTPPAETQAAHGTQPAHGKGQPPQRENSAAASNELMAVNELPVKHAAPIIVAG